MSCVNQRKRRGSPSSPGALSACRLPAFQNSMDGREGFGILQIGNARRTIAVPLKLIDAASQYVTVHR